MKTFINGFMMGLAYVAPIGVQNLFVINTAIREKFKKVLFTALIVMFFDVTLSLACFYGVGAIMDKFNTLKLIILSIGSLFVLYIGFSILKSKPNVNDESKTSIPLSKVIVTAMVVTWFNPQALIDGTLLLGPFKASLPKNESTLFIIGVMSASVFWWLAISLFFHLFKAKINEKVLRVINIVCGSIIIFYGIKLIISFIKQL